LFDLTGDAGFFCLSNRLPRQSATLRFANRMLRKREENILPQKRRQVHAVIDQRGLVFALQFDEADRPVQFERVFKRLEAADAAATEGHSQRALGKNVSL